LGEEGTPKPKGSGLRVPYRVQQYKAKRLNINKISDKKRYIYNKF